MSHQYDLYVAKLVERGRKKRAAAAQEDELFPMPTLVDRALANEGPGELDAEVRDLPVREARPVDAKRMDRVIEKAKRLREELSR